LATRATASGYASNDPRARDRYLSKLSGPLLDRIDIHVEVPAVPYRELTSRQSGTSSAAMRQQVTQARATQQKRFADGTANASMDELGLSARAYDKVRRVARTIADMEAADRIQEHHLAEAVQYRLLDRRF
jgi:magnesium chelatase family protein